MSEEETAIACDESGSEGENLFDAGKPVFVHASVDLSTDEAATVMGEVRARAPSQVTEFKSEQLLQTKNRDVLIWLLDADGPLRDRAVAHLVEKDYFITAKIIDLLVEEVTHAKGLDIYTNDMARQLALTLCREGPRALRKPDWARLAGAFNSLMRAKDRKRAKATIDEFFEVVDSVRLRSTRRTVERTLGVVWQARPYVEEFQRDLEESPDGLPALDPLIPAIAQAARIWARRTHRAVRIVHDRQNVLTPKRIALMRHALAHPHTDLIHLAPPIQLLSLEQVDSETDSRVQIADLVAGACQRIAVGALRGHGDRVLCDTAGHLIDEGSLWSDRRSWKALTGREAI